MVFEKLFNVEGKLVGLHEDLEDEDQTVRQPQVSTKAKDKETGTNEGFADEEVTVVDEVNYKNFDRRERIHGQRSVNGQRDQ